MAEHVFETTSSETLYTGKIFALRRDQVRMPGGKDVTREVVEHFGAVAVVAMDDDGNIPMVYQYRHALGRRLWELPAGLLDVADEAPVAAAARELAEEVDLVAGRWNHLVDEHASPGFANELVHIYLARELSDVPDSHRHVRDQEEAQLEVRMVELDDAVAMVLRGEITNAAAVIGLLAAARARDQGWAGLRPA